MGNKKIYLAGPMFTDADRNARLHEAKMAKDILLNLNITNIELYVPLLVESINDKSNMPTAKMIFDTDDAELGTSSAIVACLDGEDAGVMAELGIAYADDIPTFTYNTDMRVPTAGEYDGIYVPYGYNQFVVGLVENTAPIRNNFEETFIDAVQLLLNI